MKNLEPWRKCNRLSKKPSRSRSSSNLHRTDNVECLRWHLNTVQFSSHCKLGTVLPCVTFRASNRHFIAIHYLPSYQSRYSEIHLLFSFWSTAGKHCKTQIISSVKAALWLSGLSLTGSLRYMKNYAQLHLLTSIWIIWWGGSTCSAQRWKNPSPYRARGFVRAWGSLHLLSLDCRVLRSQSRPRCWGSYWGG